MGLGFRWLLLLALIYRLGSGSARRGGQMRHRHHYPQHSMLAGSSSRWDSMEVGQRLDMAGSLPRPPVRPPRQVIQPLLPKPPVSLQCGEGIMVITVQRDLFGNGRMVSLSDLDLGTQPCKPDSRSNDSIAIFEVKFQDCGITLKMAVDFIIYSTYLIYNPTSASHLPVTRTNRAIVPIQCFYPRHGNVSSKAIQPTWAPYTTTMISEERLSFFLQLMTDDWTAVRPSLLFNLGDVLHMEASVEDTEDHIPLILYVDSCVATTSPDVGSTPSYEIIEYNGCLVDGRQADVSSSFRSPRTQAHKLQFTVDAFRFLDETKSEIYITCDLKAVPDSEIPNPVNKACSYSRASNSWLPVEGPTDICQCCNIGNCELAEGKPTRWGPIYGRTRGLGKREANGHLSEAFSKAAIGPLIIKAGGLALQPEHSRAHKMSSDSQSMVLWVLMAVVSVGMVMVIVCIGVIGKIVLNKRSTCCQ